MEADGDFLVLDLTAADGVLVGVVVFGLAILLIFSYDIVKVEWITFMEIQESYKPMENPLPPPPDSIPVEGAAYLPGLPAPENPVPADETSISRGEELFALNCAMCLGPKGRGDGIVGAALVNHPADMAGERVLSMSDGDIFLTISNGVRDKPPAWRMPPLNENLTVRERWDVVNFVREVLQKEAQP
jgi:mono/diheme cytochrome c family protein